MVYIMLILNIIVDAFAYRSDVVMSMQECFGMFGKGEFGESFGEGVSDHVVGGNVG
jgi:hypothetical protein